MGCWDDVSVADDIVASDFELFVALVCCSPSAHGGDKWTYPNEMASHHGRGLVVSTIKNCWLFCFAVLKGSWNDLHS